MTVLDRPDWRGALANIALPLLAGTLIYAFMLATGIGRDSPAFARLPFDPSGWIAVVIWVVLFAFYGITRWCTVVEGAEGRRTSMLVVALMVWAMIYAFLACEVDGYWLDALNLVSILLGSYVAARVVRLSRLKAAWLVPPFLWKVVALVLGLAPLLGYGVR